MSKKQLFRRRTDYTPAVVAPPTPPSSASPSQAATSGPVPAPDASTGLPGPIEDQSITEWAIRTFFDQLFKVAIDEVPLEQALANFRVVSEEINSLDPDDRQQVIHQVDTFVGRVRQELEPVLTQWYRSFRQ